MLRTSVRALAPLLFQGSSSIPRLPTSLAGPAQALTLTTTTSPSTTTTSLSSGSSNSSNNSSKNGSNSSTSSTSGSSSGTSVGDQEFIDFPGGKIPYTKLISFVGGPKSDQSTLPGYVTIGLTGREVPGVQIPHPLSQEEAVKMYTCMATLQAADTLFYDAQRQGRFSFYLTCQGEEASTVGSAAALEPEDEVFAQYREQGVLMWRGYTLQQFAHQLMGNKHEPGKGRQMPIHYGSKELHYHTISSPLATQMPHAVGAAYALKLNRSKNVSVVYFGEGAASEGDAHAAFNFAAVLSAPCVFICRNNGYAISTPAREQYKGDGVASRGAGYGMSAIRVDGGDARAVYNVVKEARRIASEEQRPVLVECISYRSGHHSTSDDSSRYRTTDEMRSWKSRDPVTRFRQWIHREGWWSEEKEAALRKSVREQVMSSLDAAAKVAKPPLSDLFTDVYADLPPNLREQQSETFDLVAKHPELVPSDMPIK